MSTTMTLTMTTASSTTTTMTLLEGHPMSLPILPKDSAASQALGAPPPKPPRVPAQPFNFLSLPSELRIKIYDYFFEDLGEDVLDLGPGNWKRIHKKLALMRVCRLIHEEATHFFYSTQTFRIFPTFPGRYFKSKKPLLARLKPHQRECLTSLELRLGPGWNAPPRGWAVNDALGLADCVNVRLVTVFVECDPSDGVFKGFRRSEGFYEGFCRNLLQDVLSGIPNVRVLRFDAWSSVKKSGAMMQTLLGVAAQWKGLVRWGPERGWTDEDEGEGEPVGASIASVSAAMENLSVEAYGNNILVGA
ncbi:hypothetical protein ESCO_006188 [Escovopsis weberi]|uniref:F-box domain-containing protein n=1 Tax=Escovopsis weberi TaxID=150374 RepID=A0A0M8N413_ESCWE|nr:hypothetical protein ESCO_006188 [Escovopsis weberi]